MYNCFKWKGSGNEKARVRFVKLIWHTPSTLPMVLFTCAIIYQKNIPLAALLQQIYWQTSYHVNANVACTQALKKFALIAKVQANTNADYVLPRWSHVSLPTLSWERVESGHKSRHIISERNDCTLLCSQLMCRYKILALFPDLFHDSILCKFRTASDERAWPGNEAYKIPLYTQVYYCPSRGSWLKAWKRNSRICIPPHLSGR